MAELAAAGSAVGIISLAITTCQGVLSYYNSWDTQDQNISHAKGRIETLRSSLSALEEILPKISSSSVIAGHVERCVLSCKEGTARLEQFLGKCRKNSAPTSLIDRLRDCRQKAIFPFRQSSLDSLTEILRDLEDNLGTALRVLQLDTSEAQFRRTSDLVDLTKSTASSVDGASRGISIIDHKVDVVMGALPQIQQGVAQFTSDVPMLHSSITSMEQSMERRLQAIERVTSCILPGFQTRLDQLPLRIEESLAASTALGGRTLSVETSGLKSTKSAMSTTLNDMEEDARKLQLALAQRPSILRTVCDETGGLEMNIERISTMMARNRITQDGRNGKRTQQIPYCSCSTLTRRRVATYSIGSVEFFKTSMESCKHSTICPFYIGTEATTTVGLKMAYYGRLLANTVRATISITAGAGGFSINPCLNHRALVPRNSPAFSLLNLDELIRLRRSTPLSQTNEVCEYFESILQQLYELFKDKAASPTDIDEDGETLLTKLCDCLFERLEHNTEGFRILFMGLVAAGVPLNETDSEGRNVLEFLANYVISSREEIRTERNYAELAFEAGAELPDSWVRDYKYPLARASARHLEITIKFDKWMDDSECGALSAAILCRSERNTEQILHKSPASIHERNSQGQSPLHLSCTWPKGVILLLRCGSSEIIDRTDTCGHLPLAYACASNCLEAVKLMLEADSALSSPEKSKHWSSRGNYSFFDVATRTSTDEIISQLQTALVDRRSRLYSLATTKLCRKDLEELRITDDRILDEKAFDVYKALAHRNVPIPSALRPPLYRTTLFHNTGLFPALGDSLYGRGFIDVDGIDDEGRTPLMTMGYPNDWRLENALQRSVWLISKGTDPRRKSNLCEGMRCDPSTTATDYICSWVGVAVYSQTMFGSRYLSPKINLTWLFGTLDKLDDNCQSLLRGCFYSKLDDDCLCSCSSHGCTPAVMMLKGITNGSIGCWGNQQPRPTEGHFWVIERILSTLDHRHEAWRWLTREIIRYETFEKLGLTHTCCKVDHEGYGMPAANDTSESAEIRDEERLLLSKLDTLVAEFQEKYTELGVTLPEFLRGYWKARMEEVEREEEPLDDEEIARIRDLGVILHEVESEEEPLDDEEIAWIRD